MSKKSRVRHISHSEELPTPSFTRGVTKLADFKSLKDKYAKFLYDSNADYLALLSDWLTTGEDIQQALDEARRDSDVKETA